MSDNEDAEWIDLDKVNNPATQPPGPNNPPPRPTSPGIPPRRRPIPPNGRRPRRPFPRGGGRDAADQEPPSSGGVSQATIISASVVGAVIFIFLFLLVLYLFVLRKKLRTVKRKQMSSQYSLRVEDVTHLDIDDSAKLYVNTTDLQKLVSSVRVKSKQPPPPIPSTLDYPDVVQVGRPPMSLPASHEVDKISKSASVVYFENEVFPSPEPSTIQEEAIYSNITEVYPPPSISRPAPAPPVKKLNTDEQRDQKTFFHEKYSELSLNKPKISNKPNLTPEQLQYVNGQTDNVSSTSENEDEFKMQPVFNLSNPSIYENSSAKSTIKPALPLTKPRSLNTVTSQSQKESNLNRRRPSPPKALKPNRSGAQAKPHLPPLKMNLRPAAFTSLGSNASTPDTAVSFIADTATPTGEDTGFDPSTLSVKKKMALLQGKMNNNNPTTRPL